MLKSARYWPSGGRWVGHSPEDGTDGVRTQDQGNEFGRRQPEWLGGCLKLGGEATTDIEYWLRSQVVR